MSKQETLSLTEVKGKIQQFNDQYIHCIDDDLLEEWPEFFIEDCTYKIISRENYARKLPSALIYCKSKGMLKDRISAHRNANIFEAHFYRHIVSNSLIVGESNGVYQVQSNYVVFQTKLDGNTEVYNTGKYVDQVIFEEGEPKLKERLVVYDTLNIPSLLVTPI
jgi:anthranilate 1,2-dioxygenase small subunit